MFQELELEQFLPRLEQDPNYIHTIIMELPGFKKLGQSKIREEVLESAQAQARDLVMGGKFARMLEEQECNVEWRSLIHSLPRGLLGFAARMTTNSLPSPDNLARWKKVVISRSPLCEKVPCTLFHLLSNCPVSLQQGRYDYRHDSVLSYLYSVVRKARSDQKEVYCDLQGSRMNGVTNPSDIILTSSKPDLVIVDRSTSPTRVDLVELTIPWDSGAEGARARKEVRYASLVEDIKEKGYSCSHTTLEVGVRGHINPRNKSTLTWLCSLARERKTSKFISTVSKLALLGSYSVWVARRSPDRTAGNLLKHSI